MRSNLNKFLSKKEYSRLTVIGVPYRYKKQFKVTAKCECGTVNDYYINNLMSGNTVSCGCYTKEQFIKRSTTHGYRLHPLYNAWKNMIDRCHNPKNSHWKWYGERGISVCMEWRGAPNRFIEWALVNGYQKGLEIDRENNDGNYEPSNCRFVTHMVNMQNTSRTKQSILKVKQELN